MVQHLVIPDTVQASYVLGSSGKVFRVVNHLLIPTGQAVTPALADALFLSLRALWTTNLAPHCPPGTSFSGALLRDLRNFGLPEVASTSGGAPGSDTITEALPFSIAACITLRTARAGRQFRGRAYWPGFSEGANGANGQMTAATKTALDTFATGYIAASNVNGLQLGVAHRPTAFDPITGLPISPGLGFTTPVTQVICRDAIWDSQRRRNQ